MRIKIGKRSLLISWPVILIGFWRHGQKHTWSVNLLDMKTQRINWGSPDDLYEKDGEICIKPFAPKEVR